MTSSFDLNGKRILVTGASSGLGQASAVAAAQAGAFVLLLGRNVERLEETAALCEGRSASIAYDLTADLDDIPKKIIALVGQFGPLDGLVHSAGIDFTRPLRAVRAKNILDVFTTNAATAAMLMKGLSLKGNFNEAGSSAVLLSSVVGCTGSPGKLCYSMSKGAVECCARTLAMELLKDKIRVNSVAPAAIRTPMMDNGYFGAVLNDEGRKLIEDRHPMGFGRPEDVAGAVLYLLSDASRYVTGTTLYVDGGYTVQ